MSAAVPAATRVLISRPNGPFETDERASLRAAGLRLIDVGHTAARHRTVWRSGTESADLVLDQDLSNQDVACAYFTGPEQVDLAVRIGPILNYLPAEVMHLGARTSPVTDERRVAVRVLGQLHATEDDASYWDRDLGETLARARQDVDPGVRLDALIAEMKTRPDDAAELLRGELAGEQDPGRRKLLEDLALVAHRASGVAARAPAGRPGRIPLPEGALALPFFNDDRPAEFAGRFSGIADVQRPVDAPGGTARIELRLTELDATLIYLAGAGAPVGCLYISGPERVVAATGTAPAIHFFPAGLAVVAVRSGVCEQTRALGALALSQPPPADVLAPETGETGAPGDRES